LAARGAPTNKINNLADILATVATVIGDSCQTGIECPAVRAALCEIMRSGGVAKC
jgi:hypothetical protein